MDDPDITRLEQQHQHDLEALDLAADLIAHLRRQNTDLETAMTAMRAIVIGLGRMGTFHAKALTDHGYKVTTIDPAGHADHPAPPSWTWDAAAVATPIDDLAGITTTLLEHGTPTLVEKPVATDTATIRRLQRTQAMTGTPCAVGFVERFNPRVIDLKANLHGATTATFTRHNTRPSPNVELDLALHDVDLAHHLGLDPVSCTFDTRDNAPRVVRLISTYAATVDLTAHQTSPLHALWTAFLDGDDHPTLSDALAAHESLNATRTPLGVAA